MLAVTDKVFCFLQEEEFWCMTCSINKYCQWLPRIAEMQTKILTSLGAWNNMKVIRCPLLCVPLDCWAHRCWWSCSRILSRGKHPRDDGWWSMKTCKGRCSDDLQNAMGISIDLRNCTKYGVLQYRKWVAQCTYWNQFDCSFCTGFGWAWLNSAAVPVYLFICFCFS